MNWFRLNEGKASIHKRKCHWIEAGPLAPQRWDGSLAVKTEASVQVAHWPARKILLTRKLWTDATPNRIAERHISLSANAENHSVRKTSTSYCLSLSFSRLLEILARRKATSIAHHSCPLLAVVAECSKILVEYMPAKKIVKAVAAVLSEYHGWIERPIREVLGTRTSST